MKIGILTFHRAHNYGAVLQCFALQTIIIKLGGNVSVIDYTTPNITKAYDKGYPNFKGKSLFAMIKGLALSILIGRSKYNRYKSFNEFIETQFLLSTRSDNNFEDIAKDMSIILYGSDQIWNPHITGDDEYYFGKGYRGKKIAYAASAGKGESLIKNHLSQLQLFDSIGIREKSLYSTLSSLGFKNASVNIDPTLLLTQDDWNSILNLGEKATTYKYVLVYTLRERNKTIEMAKKLADSEGLKLIEIGATVTPFKPNYRLENLGPIDFLSYIRHAEYVVTNSFHGTVFSIIFKRKFFTVKLNDGEDGRVTSLLSSIGLIHRLKDLGTVLSPIPIDYSESDKVLNNLRNESINYLKTKLDL